MAELICPQCGKSDSFRVESIESNSVTLWLDGDADCYESKHHECVETQYFEMRCESCQFEANYSEFENNWLRAETE